MNLKLFQLKETFMKKEFSIPACRKSLRQFVAAIVLAGALMIPGKITAQADSTAKTKPGTEEAVSLLSPSLELVSVQNTDGSIDLVSSVKTKVKGTFIKLPLLKVKFLYVSDTAEKELGFVITDRVGKAVFNCKPGTIEPGKEGKLHFKAVFAGNKSMEASEAEVSVKKARLEIIPVKGDSLLSVKVKLSATGGDTLVKDVTIGVFVQRSFNPLKLGEATTDENGEATVEIPAKLPGDAKGNIVLLAKIEENEAYGNLEAKATQQWGIPVSDKLQELPRALWSAHPPLWMLITFIILVGTVWGHYIVIIYELFRLRKEEPHPPAATTSHT